MTSGNGFFYHVVKVLPSDNPPVSRLKYSWAKIFLRTDIPVSSQVFSELDILKNDFFAKTFKVRRGDAAKRGSRRVLDRHFPFST